MLSVQNIHHAYAGESVLHGVSLEVSEGEIVCLLGPSGCGKTTLLRIIAGLEPGYQGTVRVAGQTMGSIPVEDRGFGLMFQEFALFPHMSVTENIAFGLKMQGIPAKERQKRVQAVLSLVNLSGYGEREIDQLSGGERQRVALARSLAPEPRLLMLDEPLGALDALLRERLVVELRQIIRQVGLTSVYVTHDRQEAYAVADRIAIMNAGRIEQIATPYKLYHRPRTEFVARFLGLTNIIPVLDWQNGSADTIIGSFDVPEASEALLLHPESLSLTLPSADDVLTGDVIARIFRGGTCDIQVQITDTDLQLTLAIPAGQSLPDPQAQVGVRITRGRVVGLQSSQPASNRSI